MDLVLDAWVQMIATARAAGVPVTLQDLVSRFDGTDFVILPTYYSAETGARLSPPGKEAPKAATISQAAALSLTATFSSSFWVPVVCNQNPTNGHPARFQVPGSLAWGKSTPPGTVRILWVVDSVFEAGYFGNSADDYHPARRRAQI